MLKKNLFMKSEVSIFNCNYERNFTEQILEVKKVCGEYLVFFSYFPKFITKYL